MAQHYALERNPTKAKEIHKIGHVEGVIRTEKKYKWYLKERYGMFHTLLVPDFQVHHILAVFEALAWTLLMKAMVIYSILEVHIPYFIVVISVLWGPFTVWKQLIIHDRWKMLTYEG